MESARTIGSDDGGRGREEGLGRVSECGRDGGVYPVPTSYSKFLFLLRAIWAFGLIGQPMYGRSKGSFYMGGLFCCNFLQGK